MTRTLLNKKIRFTFRHKWDEKCKSDPLNRDFKSWEISVFFEKNKVLQKLVPHSDVMLKTYDLVLINDYKFGCSLLVCKFWFNFNKGTALIESKK